MNWADDLVFQVFWFYNFIFITLSTEMFSPSFLWASGSNRREKELALSELNELRRMPFWFLPKNCESYTKMISLGLKWSNRKRAPCKIKFWKRFLMKSSIKQSRKSCGIQKGKSWPHSKHEITLFPIPRIKADNLLLSSTTFSFVCIEHKCS